MWLAEHRVCATATAAQLPEMPANRVDAVTGHIDEPKNLPLFVLEAWTTSAQT